MKYLIILIALLLPPALPVRALTSPSCDRPSTAAAIGQALSDAQADHDHEWVTFVDCWTDKVVLSVQGARNLTRVESTYWQTVNNAMIHTHPDGPQASIEDMQAMHDLNPLVFIVSGYDREAQHWTTCEYRKAAFDSMWPVIDKHARAKLYERQRILYITGQGGWYRRVLGSYTALWSQWTVENGISMECHSG